MLRRGVIDFPEPLKLNELPATWWIPEYRRRRYLGRLSDDELRRRGQDLINNALRLDDDGKYRLRFYLDEQGRYAVDRGLDWARLLTHYHVEVGEFRSGLFDLKNTDGSPVVAQRLADESGAWRPGWVARSYLGYEYLRPTTLFKFGERRWNEQLLHSGQLRIMPASAFGDPSLNRAIGDDELSIFQTFLDGSQKTYTIDGDFYVSCLTMAYDYRLFADLATTAAC